MGGHYFAYIKSFSAGKWYEFNDSMVREISQDALTETYGETDKRSYFNSGTNAYMLMYRQCDEARNAIEYTRETIPTSILKLIEEENKRDKEKEEEKDRGQCVLSK
jgi:ubiquitin carboxyl-terminal hydrolase 47